METVTQTANRLIKQHGEAAPRVASEAIAEFKRSEKRDRQAFWTSVVIETKVLLARDYGW